MAIQYEIIKEATLLRVLLRGYTQDVDEVHAYVEAVSSALKQSGLKKLLIDESEFINQLNMADLYELADIVLPLLQPDVKVAFCCSPKAEKITQFWEDMMVNRNRLVRYFSRIEEAEAWLG